MYPEVEEKASDVILPRLLVIYFDHNIDKVESNFIIQGYPLISENAT